MYWSRKHPSWSFSFSCDVSGCATSDFHLGGPPGEIHCFFCEMKAPQLAEQNIFPQGVPQGGNHWRHTQKHHTKIRKTTKGDFEANIWTNVQRRFHNVGWHTFLMVLGPFIKVDPFGSSTKNDATGGPHLFGPTTDFCYGIKVRFWRKCPTFFFFASRNGKPFCKIIN